jgi:chemotaxis protein MotB
MKHYFLILFASSMFFACVPKKKFKELEAKYANLEKMNQEKAADLARTQSLLNACNDDKARLNKELDELKEMNSKLIRQATEMSSLSNEQAKKPTSISCSDKRKRPANQSLKRSY